MRKKKRKKEIVINDYTTHGYMGMDVWRGFREKNLYTGLILK